MSEENGEVKRRNELRNVAWHPEGGEGTCIHYLYGYVPPNGVVILKLLI